MIPRWSFCALLSIFTIGAASCKDSQAPAQEAISLQTAEGEGASPEAAPIAQAPAAIERDWLCPELATTERPGVFGDARVAHQIKEHAGIRSVHLRSDAEGALLLAFLAEDDIENHRGLSKREASPARSTHLFRMLGDTWQDLGRPFQLMGWDARLDVSIGDGPLHIAIEAGIGDVRRALVASCEASGWQQAPRYTGKNFEAAGMIASDAAQAMGNIEIVSGPVALQEAHCQPPGSARGPDVPLRVLRPGFHGQDSVAIDLAEPGDCRVPRGFVAAARGEAVAVAYEQCGASDSAEHVSKSGCEIASVWHDGKSWQRLPAFELASADDIETRHALALSERGPVLAVAGEKELRVYRAAEEGWQALPALPDPACQMPVALQSDPPRLVTRSCGGPDLGRAYQLSDSGWRAIAKALPLKPPAGTRGRPDIAGHWIGETAYLAIGYYGAPVARVFASAENGWQQILQAQVDPNRPPAPAAEKPL